MTPTQRKAMEQALEAIRSTEAYKYGSVMLNEAAEDLISALAEQPAEQSANPVGAVFQEPVAWQRRMRLRETVRTFPQQSVWTDWFPCTEQAAQEFANSKDEQWEYEVRTLYTAPQPAKPAEQAPAPGYCKHCKQYTIEEPLPAEQEPVAWMSPGKERLEFSRKDTVYGSHTIPLYPAPQPAQVVNLTDEQASVIADKMVQAIEAHYRTRGGAI